MWFRFALGFIVGAALGSFGTMLAYRLPRRLSIVAPRSHCPSCQTPLGVKDLVPLASWLATRGRCRHCGAKIGAQYLKIELATSLIGGVAGIFIPRLF
jgi:leader peptidase (prepilin peptidase)/N-methyltransferase